LGSGQILEREAFAKVMQEVLDSLPEEFRDRIRNVAVLVEDFSCPASPHPPTTSHVARSVIALEVPECHGALTSCGDVGGTASIIQQKLATCFSP